VSGLCREHVSRAAAAKSDLFELVPTLYRSTPQACQDGLLVNGRVPRGVDTWALVAAQCRRIEHGVLFRRMFAELLHQHRLPIEGPPPDDGSIANVHARVEKSGVGGQSIPPQTQIAGAAPPDIGAPAASDGGAGAGMLADPRAAVQPGTAFCGWSVTRDVTCFCTAIAMSMCEYHRFSRSGITARDV
jgi:hypothetical protein